MIPQIGTWYRVKRRDGIEAIAVYDGDKATIGGVTTYDLYTSLPHDGDEGRGISIGATAGEIIEEFVDA